MKQTTIGRLLARVYQSLPLRRQLLRMVTHAEGGPMFSTTLRQVLREHHGVEVGDYSYGSLLVPGNADRFTKIGTYVSIGRQVRRIGAAHPLEAPCLHPFWYNPKLGLVTESDDVRRSACEISSGAWIGDNVVILPGCSRIGVGAVVGAGSVVTHDVADFAVVAGNPARVLRTRLDADLREELLAAGHWDMSPQLAAQYITNLRKR